jgi:hypothetical protein
MIHQTCTIGEMESVCEEMNEMMNRLFCSV